VIAASSVFLRVEPDQRQRAIFGPDSGRVVLVELHERGVVGVGTSVMLLSAIASVWAMRCSARKA
jgi:hypothetical protein